MDVLVVDDSKAMRLIVKRTLRKVGFSSLSVREAANGKEGLAAVLEAQPDLVLCDLNMPEMNGMEFLRTLREEGNKVKFGLVTSESAAEVRREAMDAGVSFLVVKPFTAEALQQALDASSAQDFGIVQSHDNSGAGTLPGVAAVADIFSMLLPKDVSSKKGKPVNPGPKNKTVVVLYGADDGTTEVVCMCDIKLAAAAGASLTMLPAGNVDDAVKAGGIESHLTGNVHEVFNVLGSLFVGDKPGSGSIRELQASANALPEDVASLVKSSKVRVDVELNVDGYGGGSLSLVRIA